MEISCKRCHSVILPENCYCPNCGLPQFVYHIAESAARQARPEHWDGAIRDADSIDWKPALKASFKLAIPAGLLCSGYPLLGIFGLVWMAAAGAGAVVLYMRNQRPAWITVGAGARIGLVTGLLGGWIAAATMGTLLFTSRFLFHEGQIFDNFWQVQISDKLSQQWTAAGLDAPTILAAKTMLNSPEGRGGITLSVIIFLVLALIAFATAGGAFGARLTGRTRQPEP